MVYPGLLREYQVPTTPYVVRDIVAASTDMLGRLLITAICSEASTSWLGCMQAAEETII